MSKFGEILFGVWMALAICSFVSGFFIPIGIIKTIALSFGFINMGIILSWAIAVIQARREYKKQTKKEE